MIAARIHKVTNTVVAESYWEQRIRSGSLLCLPG